MKAQLTISRPNFGCGKEAIAIHIKDKASGKVITEVYVGYADFAQAVTGLSAIPVEVNKLINESDLQKVGKQKVVEKVFCKKTYLKDEQKKIVLEDFSKRFSDSNWELMDDGTRTQQNEKQHKYTLVKWVDEENL